MRVRKAQMISRVDSNASASASASIDSGCNSKRRQSLTGAVSAFAAELRTRPKKSTFNLPHLQASAGKSTEDLSLANAAARSKSCSHLPATANASTNASGSGNGNGKDEPLLTLVLASTSFLDTVISESGERLYVIDTKGARTNICREDPVQGIAHVGAINWVDKSAEVRPLGPRRNATIQMAHGRRYYVDDFLRRTKLSSSRLFEAPHYPHSLKWKRSGGCCKLVVTKGKTTIAVLEPAVHGSPARIKVFDTLYERDATRPQREHRGVPVILLDYLIATALLMTAEKDEWLAAANGTASSGSASTAPFGGSGVHGSIHRWRMQVQPEPEPLEPEPLEEEELESRQSTLDELASTSSVLDIAPSSSSNSNSTSVEISSDPGVGLTRRTSSPQSFAPTLSLSRSLRRPARDSSRPSTAPTLTPTSPNYSYRFPRAPVSGSDLSTSMLMPVHTPTTLSIPVAAHHHPFASEPASAVTDEEAPSSSVCSPLTRVLPPALGVSLGETDPGPSSGATPTSAISPAWSSAPRSPDSHSESYSIATTEGGSTRHSHVRARSAESLAGLETPRLGNASLPTSTSPMSPMSPEGGTVRKSGKSGRPATADATMRSGSGRTVTAGATMTTSGYTGGNGNTARSPSGRRPFRPLPKPPVHVATVPLALEPTPTPPSGAGARAPYVSSDSLMGSNTVASFPQTTTYPSPLTWDDPDLNTNTNTDLNANPTASGNDGPRNLRRTTSEVTLSAKISVDSGVQGQAQESESEVGHDLRRNSSVLKTLYRRSVYKEPIPSLSSSPSPSPVPTNMPLSRAMSTRTLSESDSGAPKVVTIPHTAPLRIRHPRPFTAGTTPTSAVARDYDTIPRASTSSSSSHTHSTAHQNRYQEEDVDSNVDESECAPPAYDTIDFSHPPLKTPTPTFRGVG